MTDKHEQVCHNFIGGFVKDKVYKNKCLFRE